MTPEVSTEKLRELMAKATPGPWEVASGAIFGSDQHLIASEGSEHTQTPEWPHNSKLIVAMHEALPALLADRERLDWLEKNWWRIQGPVDRVPPDGSGLRAAIDPARE